MPYSVTSRDATSYQIDLMTFEKQYVILPIYNLFYTNSTTNRMCNNSATNTYGFFADMDGQVSISSNNSVANIASVPLFNVKVSYLVTFFHRL